MCTCSVFCVDVLMSVARAACYWLPAGCQRSLGLVPTPMQPCTHAPAALHSFTCHSFTRHRFTPACQTCCTWPCTGACASDVKAFCKDVSPGEGRVAACITKRLRDQKQGNVQGEGLAGWGKKRRRGGGGARGRATCRVTGWRGRGRRQAQRGDETSSRTPCRVRGWVWVTGMGGAKAQG